MDGGEQARLEQAREGKRNADRQLRRDDADRDAPEDEPTGDVKAAPEVLAARRRVRIRRPDNLEAGKTGVFSGLQAAAPAVTATLATTGFGAAAAGGASPSSAPAAAPVNPFARLQPSAAAAPAANGVSSLNAAPNAAAVPSVFGANSNFKFSFSAPPPATKPVDAGSPSSTAPANGGVVTPTSAQHPVLLERKETEEDPSTTTTFNNAMTLLSFADGEWHDRGEVTVKVLTNTAASPPWAAVAAYAAKTMRLVVSAAIGSAVRLGKSSGRSVVFAALSGAAPQMYTLRAAKGKEELVTEFVAAVKAAEAALAAPADAETR